MLESSYAVTEHIPEYKDTKAKNQTRVQFAKFSSIVFYNTIAETVLYLLAQLKRSSTRYLVKV